MGQEETENGYPPRYAHEGVIPDHGSTGLFVIVYSMLPKHTNIGTEPMKWPSFIFQSCFNCRGETLIVEIFAIIRRGFNIVEGSIRLLYRH